MIEFFRILDIASFRFMNGSLQNPLLNVLMPFITDLNKHTIVLVLFILLLLWMIIRGSRQVRLAALILIVTILITDQLNSFVIKYWFERLRPCHTLHNVHLLVSCGSGFSFPSSHAVNNFAGALVLSFFLPRGTWYLFGYAALVAFSRVYVGVHYPSDVLGGGIIGLTFGGCVLFLFLKLERIWYHFMNKRSQKKF